MSVSQQDFGFDRTDLAIIGKTRTIPFVISNIQVADIASAEWALFTLTPEEDPNQTSLVTKTVAGGGINLANNGSDVDVVVTLDPADTALPTPLAGGDYFHRLDYVHTGGDQFEVGRGRARLTPRV